MLRCEIAASRSGLVFLIDVQRLAGRGSVEADVLQKLPRRSRRPQVLCGKLPGLVAVWRDTGFGDVTKPLSVVSNRSSKVFQIGHLISETFILSLTNVILIELNEQQCYLDFKISVCALQIQIGVFASQSQLQQTFLNGPVPAVLSVSSKHSQRSKYAKHIIYKKSFYLLLKQFFYIKYILVLVPFIIGVNVFLS